MVSNGTYNAGGMVTPGYALTNRVCITNAITVQSVNGPTVTIIEGAAGTGPVGGFGKDAIRGVFMTNACSLTGFTITNGYTLGVGGDRLFDQSGGGIRIATLTASVSNCVITSNTAILYGGGVYGGTLNNCRLSGNYSRDDGGGAYYCDLNNCTLNGNVGENGGGALGGTLNNCLLYANHADENGGATFNATLNNCTLYGNTAELRGGGMYSGTINNGIVWGNSATNSGNNLDGTTVRYTCAQNGVTEGTDGCTTNNPLFVNSSGTNYQLQGTSSCVNAGDNTYAPTNETPYDLAGMPRIIGTTVDMGAYEADIAFADASKIDDTGDGRSWTTAKKTIQAAVDLVSDGGMVLVTNGTYNAGGAAAPGNALTNRVCILSPITVRSVNGPAETFIAGSPGSNGSNDLDSVRGVFMTNGCTLAGFTVTNGYTMETWSSMDGNGGGLLSYTNCLASNCVFTGNSAVNCGGGIYQYYGGMLTHCTIEGNHCRGASGGIHAGTVSYSTISSNRAYSSAGSESANLNNCLIRDNVAIDAGGGMSGGEIRNCLVINNIAGSTGGAGTYASFYNSTLYGNTANYGGGAHNGTVVNCIVWSNTASIAGNNVFNAGATNTCAPDGVTNGVDGNITSDPLFIDPAGGNYQLQANSPCMNRGENAYSPTNVTPYDLADKTRIVFTTVDMGAYERQFLLTAYSGPAAGGNSITITNGLLGSGSDITNVTVCGTAATITTQGVNWVTVTLGRGSSSGDIVIQSASKGETTFFDAYEYLQSGASLSWMLLLFE